MLFIGYPDKAHNINSDHYEAELVHLKEEIARKWPNTKKKKVPFGQDSAP